MQNSAIFFSKKKLKKNAKKNSKKNLCIVELPREFAKGRELHNCPGNCTIAEIA
jgi:hypothetical protein